MDGVRKLAEQGSLSSATEDQRKELLKSAKKGLYSGNMGADNSAELKELVESIKTAEVAGAVDPNLFATIKKIAGYETVTETQQSEFSTKVGQMADVVDALSEDEKRELYSVVKISKDSGKMLAVMEELEGHASTIRAVSIVDEKLLESVREVINQDAVTDETKTTFLANVNKLALQLDYATEEQKKDFLGILESARDGGKMTFAAEDKITELVASVDDTIAVPGFLDMLEASKKLRRNLTKYRRSPNIDTMVESFLDSLEDLVDERARALPDENEDLGNFILTSDRYARYGSKSSSHQSRLDGIKKKFNTELTLTDILSTQEDMFLDRTGELSKDEIEREMKLADKMVTMASAATVAENNWLVDTLYFLFDEFLEEKDGETSLPNFEAKQAARNKFNGYEDYSGYHEGYFDKIDYIDEEEVASSEGTYANLIADLKTEFTNLNPNKVPAEKLATLMEKLQKLVDERYGNHPSDISMLEENKSSLYDLLKWVEKIPAFKGEAEKINKMIADSMTGKAKIPYSERLEKLYVDVPLTQVTENRKSVRVEDNVAKFMVDIEEVVNDRFGSHDKDLVPETIASNKGALLGLLNWVAGATWFNSSEKNTLNDLLEKAGTERPYSELIEEFSTRLLSISTDFHANQFILALEKLVAKRYGTTEQDKVDTDANKQQLVNLLYTASNLPSMSEHKTRILELKTAVDSGAAVVATTASGVAATGNYALKITTMTSKLSQVYSADNAATYMTDLEKLVNDRFGNTPEDIQSKAANKTDLENLLFKIRANNHFSNHYTKVGELMNVAKNDPDPMFNRPINEFVDFLENWYDTVTAATATSFLAHLSLAVDRRGEADGGTKSKLDGIVGKCRYGGNSGVLYVGQNVTVIGHLQSTMSGYDIKFGEKVKYLLSRMETVSQSKDPVDQAMQEKFLKSAEFLIKQLSDVEERNWDRIDTALKRALHTGKFDGYEERINRNVNSLEARKTAIKLSKTTKQDVETVPESDGTEPEREAKSTSVAAVQAGRAVRRALR